jgi:hypothetical protein
MSNDYFTPVDLDAAFPKEPEPVQVPSGDPAKDHAKAEAIVYARQTINEELSRVRTGTSKHVQSAQQFTENKTPFCIALGMLSGKATPVDALKVVALAKQDFGDKFANFVLEQFKPLFGDK